MTLNAALRRRSLPIVGASFVIIAGVFTACGGSSSPAATSTTSGAAGASPTAVSGDAKTAAATKAATGAAAKPGAATFQDPCSLLTQAEADASVGQSLGAGKQVATLDDCLWTTSDFTSGVDVTVGGWTEVRAAATSSSAQPVSISGVGDEALNLNGSNGSLLYVRKGEQGFLIVINGPKVDGAADRGLAQEKVLAAAVFGRLK